VVRRLSRATRPELSRTFEDVQGYDDMVMLRGIDVQSHCEHHMAPFMGKAWIAYMPTGKVVGLSKLARLVEIFAKRLQTQETMTMQIADAIEDHLLASGRRRRDDRRRAPVHVDPRGEAPRRVDHHHPVHAASSRPTRSCSSGSWIWCGSKSDRLPLPQAGGAPGAEVLGEPDEQRDQHRGSSALTRRMGS
jgi:hypothetical protein